MEARYFIAGINIIVISLILFMVGYINGIELLMAVSSSNAILGLILTTIGLSYSIPSVKYLVRTVDTYSLLIAKILEDLGIVNPVITLCVSDREYIVYHKGEIYCKDINPGIGLSGKNPYLAIDVSRIAPAITYKSESIREALVNTIVNELSIGSRVLVTRSKEKIAIEITGIDRESIEVLSRPCNALHLIVPIVLYRVTGKTVSIVNEVVRGDRYSIEAVLK